MNKKFKFVGLPIIALLLIGSVIAVTVDYLSNSPEVNVVVDSPILLGVSNNEIGMAADCSVFTEAVPTGPLALNGVKALDTARYYIQVDVQAEEDPNQVMKDVVFNWSMTNGNNNPSCDDVANITLRIKNQNSCTSWSGATKMIPSDLGCTCYGDHCDILVDADYNPLDKNQYELNITFGNVAPDDFTFKHTIQLD